MAASTASSAHSTPSADASPSLNTQSPAGASKKSFDAEDSQDDESEHSDGEWSDLEENDSSSEVDFWPKPEEGWGKPEWWLKPDYLQSKAYMQQTLDRGEFWPWYIKEKIYIDGSRYYLPLKVTIPAKTQRSEHPSDDEIAELRWWMDAMEELITIMEKAQQEVQRREAEQQQQQQQQQQAQLVEEGAQSWGGGGAEVPISTAAE